jgi:hypothetical protein
MAKLSFKKEQKEGLFTYLHVDNSVYQSTSALENQPLSYPGTNAINTVIYTSIFYNYLALADFCCNNLTKFCIAQSSPDINYNKSFLAISASHWWYELLSDDYNGLGVDAGFTQEPSFIGKNDEVQLFSVDSFLSLSWVPEDLFGETVFQCSLFGLKQMRTEAIQSFLQSATTPELNKLLLPGELFFQLVVAKEVGYYNSLLIKSVTDIEKYLRF